MSIFPVKSATAHKHIRYQWHMYLPNNNKFTMFYSLFFMYYKIYKQNPNQILKS